MPLPTQEQVYLQNMFKMIPSITTSIQQWKAVRILMQQDQFLERTMQMNVHMCLNRYVMLFMYSTMFYFIVCFVQFFTHMLHKCNILFHFSTIFLCFTTLHVHALEDGGYKHNNLYVSVCNILSWFETMFQVRNMKRRNVTTMKVRVNHVI